MLQEESKSQIKEKLVRVALNTRTSPLVRMDAIDELARIHAKEELLVIAERGVNVVEQMQAMNNYKHIRGNTESESSLI